MSEPLFDGTLKGGSRVQQVVRMMNYAIIPLTHVKEHPVRETNRPAKRG